MHDDKKSPGKPYKVGLVVAVAAAIVGSALVVRKTGFFNKIQAAFKNWWYQTRGHAKTTITLEEKTRIVEKLRELQQENVSAESSYKEEESRLLVSYSTSIQEEIRREVDNN